MKSFFYIFILCVSIFTSACKTDMDLNSFEPKIVVEGVVENGKFPTVLLSQLIPVDMSMDSAKLTSIPIRWAKVTISDGDDEEVLVGMRNSNRLLQYEYSAYHMRGEIGKTYTLKVEYSGRTLIAKTTVPQLQPELNNIELTKVSNSDSLYYIKADVNRIQSVNNYYLFQVKLKSDTDVYRPSFLGAVDNTILNSGSSVVVYNSVRIIKDFSLYFKTKSSYVLKICQVGEFEYAFWKDYYNQIIGTANPIYPNTSNLESNIDGGLGIFYGCTSKDYIISVP